MARLFITPRELNFFSDIAKELVKDVIGQKIIYYPISELKTSMHSIYNEALQKVYDNPIEIDAMVDTTFQTDTKINQFGVDATYKIEVLLHYRDLVDKGINVAIGDFFSYGDVFYEVTEKVFLRTIYGMPEHKDGIKLIGIKARENVFDALLRGPTDISYDDPTSVQTQFVQQRGESENKDGPTADKRDLIDNGTLDRSLSGPKEVSASGDPTGKGTSFYDE